MKIIVVDDYDEMSRLGAQIIKEVIKSKPDCVLGLATGSTPIGMYRQLADSFSRGEISFKNVCTVNLDEYVGLSADNCQSYAYFMNDKLFGKVDIDKNNTHLPDGSSPDLEKSCGDYTRLLANLARDVQVLGLGSDGHIGFNEPGSPFEGHTHIVKLAESTIKDNSRLFDREEDVPRQAITMGIADIMQAKKILMLANGKNKADAVLKMVNGDIDEDCPASVLQRHSDVIVILDKEAAAYLK